jgi:alanyl-tRNA synthetase
VKLLHEANDALAGAAEALKCAPADVAQAAARTAAEALARRKAGDALLADLAKLEGTALRAKTAGPVVTRVERGVAFARALAGAIAAEGGTALIGAVDEGRGHLVFARPKGPGPPMGAILKEALAILGGKGGGSADFAQGAGAPERLDEALALAAQKVGSG